MRIFSLSGIKESYLTGKPSPLNVSLSISFGLLWGLFPVLGTCTVLCTFTALILRLNLLLIQAVNYALYPVQLALLLPFFCLGRWFTNLEVNAREGSDIGQMIATGLANPTEVSRSVLTIVVNCTVGWLATTPLLALLAFFLIKFVFEGGLDKFTWWRGNTPKGI